MNRFSKLSGSYQRVAGYLLGAVLAFALLNVILGLMYLVIDALRAPVNPVVAAYGDKVQRAYPGWEQRDLNKLLEETWSRPYVYEPFTQFKERPFQGEFVNVDEAGFRLSRDQGPWPPDPRTLNVFLFGGSTTFCYGLPDDQTIASHLQEFLRERYAGAHVYNFGRGSYYSSQERILFEQLLVSGVVPDVAIFIDGLNEFYYYEEKPHFSGVLAQLMQREIEAARPQSVAQASRAAGGLLAWLPLVRAIRSVKYRAGAMFGGGETSQGEALSEETYDDEVLLDRVIRRYRDNMKLIDATAKAYAVQAVFVWQPVPTYKYDLNEHLFAEGGFGRNTYSKYGYPRFAAKLEASPLASNFLWCADMQQGSSGPRYVDKVHYSAEMSKQLADTIYRLLVERGLLPEKGGGTVSGQGG